MQSTFDRAVFFAAVRKSLFDGSLSQGQVDGMSAILDEWENRKLTDLRWLAYMLATAFHETAKTMQPIREFGRGKGKKYGTTYYGRGLVQLTWQDNYRKAGLKLGLDLVNHPDLALDLPVAVAIMFDGMIGGWFTGRDLTDYFGAEGADWYDARRIINGTDRAADIARYATSFLAALQAAAKPAPEPAEAPRPVPAPPPPPDVEDVPGPPDAAGGGIRWGLVAFIVAAAVLGLIALTFIH